MLLLRCQNTTARENSLALVLNIAASSSVVFKEAPVALATAAFISIKQVQLCIEFQDSF